MLQIGRPLVRSQLVSVEFFVGIKSFRSHYGPRVDSASDRNEYQEYFLGERRPVHKADNPPPSCAVVTKSGSLNFLETSGPLEAGSRTALPYKLVDKNWEGAEVVYSKLILGICLKCLK